MNKKSIFSKLTVLLFALVAIIGLAQAQTTYTFSNYPAGVQYATETHVLDDDVTLYTVKCYFTTELRVYSNATNNSYFYTNGLPFYIKNLGFKMGHSVDDVNIYGSTDGDSWTLVGTIEVTASSYNDYTLSFGDNDYNYFKFDVAGSSQIRVKSMTITYKPTGPQGEAAAAPVISPSSGIYTSPVTVSMSKSSEVGSIYYTLDGATPSEESAAYTEPFTVNSTTTVKAVTVAEGMLNSSVVSATYTFPTDVANIAAFKAGNANTPYSLVNGVTFVYKNGAYTYVKDASAGLLVYDYSGVISTEYEEGDQIADLIGTRTVYASQVEMVPSMNTSEATENTGVVEPVVVTVSELLANYDAYDAQLVTIENVVFPNGFTTNTSGSTPSATFVQGNDSLLLYSRFDYDTELDTNANMNVTGFVGIYNGKVQIYPRDNNDVVEYVQVLVPELTITAPADGAQFSSMDILPVDIAVNNFVLGTDGYLKLESEFIESLFGENPVYLDQEMFAYLLEESITPLPGGTHTINASLVGMDSLELDPAVSQSVTFTVNKYQIPAPVIVPNGGTFADNVEVTIDYDEEFSFYANIVYTLDGSEPTEESELYLAPITLNESATLKVKAFIISILADYYASSETVSADFVVVNEPVLTATPTALSFSSTELSKAFTVSGAHLTEPISLESSNPHFTLSTEEIENPNSNTQVMVTFDGAEPANGVVTITSGELSAEIALTATAKLPAPVLTSTATFSDSNIVITMTSPVADAAIHYTLDGSEPTVESNVYNGPVVLNTVGTYTVKAFAAKENWENSDVVTETYQIVTPTIGDEVVYATGFEASEGFEASTVYNNTNIKYFGNEGEQWGTYYGTPSEYNTIDGGQSMQMRWYSSAPNNHGYVFTNFDIRNVTHVTFRAANSNGLKVNVAHSIDGGNTYSDGETFSVASTANEFDYVVSETGEYDYVRLRFSIEMPATTPNANSRLVIDNVEVYGVPGLTPTTVSAPVITPGSEFYYEPQTVSISCETEGAVIRYTTDGTQPDENSTVYGAPFTVNTTTTINAKAWKEGLTPSFVSTATISFPVQAENIAAFKANTSDDVQQIMSDMTFVFRSGRYIFVEDNSAALLIYDNVDSVITTEYVEGAVIQGGVFGKYKLYNGLVELEPTHNAPASTETVAVVPAVAEIPAIKSGYTDVYESKLVRINNVTFIGNDTFVQNGDTMRLFDRFNTVDIDITEGTVADIIGFVNYSTTYGYQLYPRGNEDIIVNELEKVANPEFSFQLSGEFYFMDITCATEGADIYYTIDGSDPDENSYHFTSQIPLRPDESLTIKAVAMKEGMQNSDIVTYFFTGINNHDFSYSVYPNPTSDVLVVEGDMIENIEIFSISGRIIKSGRIEDRKASIDVRDVANGTYIIRIKGSTGSYSTTFVKR